MQDARTARSTECVGKRSSAQLHDAWGGTQVCAYDPWWLCVRQKTQRDASKESGTAGMLFYGLINNVDGSWVVNPNNKVRTQQGPLHFPKNQKNLFSYLLYKASLHISSQARRFWVSGQVLNSCWKRDAPVNMPLEATMIV